MAKDIELDIKVTGLGDLKKQLMAAKDEVIALQNAKVIDQESLDKAVAKAGLLKDKFNDANEQIKIMSGGSDFEKIGSGLGLIGTQLASLDFEGASNSAKLLTGTIKNMDPKKVSSEFKAFGSTILQLGNAFVQMGLKLLMNPLFLIPALIVAVVAGIILLKDKLKIAEQAFDFFAGFVKIAVDALKNFTDWLGITSFAEEEAAKKSEENAKRRIDSNEAVSKNIEEFYKRQIDAAKAAGKDTTELEKDSIRERKKLADDSLNVTKNLIQERLKLLGIAGDEEIAALISRGAAVEEIEKSLNERKNGRTRAQNKVDAKFLFEQGKTLVAQYQESANLGNSLGVLKSEAALKQLEKDKEINAMSLALLKKAQDLRLAAMDEGFEKEFAKTKLNAQRSIEDLNTQYNALKKKRGSLTQEEIAEKEQSINNILKAQQQANDKLYNDEIKRREDIKKKRLQDQKDEEAKFDEHLKILRDYRKKYDDFILSKTGTEAEKQKAATKAIYDDQRGALRAAYFQELQDINITNEKKLELKIELNKKLKKLDELEANDPDEFKARLDRISQYVQAASGILNNIGAFFNQQDEQRLTAIQTQTDAENQLLEERRANELSNINLSESQKDAINKKYNQLKYKNDLDAFKKSEEIKKQQFNREKAIRMASIVMDTATGIMAGYRDGPIIGSALSILTLAAGAIQLATVASQKYQGAAGPSAPSLGGGGSGGTSEAVTPTFALSGNRNQGSTAEAAQANIANRNQNLNVSLRISETEITDTQNRVRRIERSAEL